MEFLVRDKNYEMIDFIGNLKKYEEELREVIWVYPDLIYPKNKLNNNHIKKEDIPDLIMSSPKKKIFMQITEMKFGEGEIIGYVFKFVDSITKKGEIKLHEESLIPFGNKEILFDLLSLNYIRTEIVSEKTGKNNLREKEEIIDNDKQVTKSQIEKGNKKSINNNLEEIAESSDDDKNIKTVELTKEKILELQTKDSKDIEYFINSLPYYGADVSLEKHRPNKERYPIGRGHEAIIKIQIGQFDNYFYNSGNKTCKHIDFNKIMNKNDKRFYNEETNKNLTVEYQSRISDIKFQTKK